MYEVTQVLSMLKLPYSKSDVKILKRGFLACPTIVGGQLALHRLIHDFYLLFIIYLGGVGGWMMDPMRNPILNPKVFGIQGVAPKLSKY